MFRTLGAALLVAAMAWLAPANAEDPKPITAGNYKLVLPNDGFFLLTLAEDKGKWEAKYVGTTLNLPPRAKVAVSNAKVTGDVVSFELSFGPNDDMGFEGRSKPDGSAVQGTLKISDQIVLVQLLPTKLKDLTDPVAIAREQFDAGEKNVAYFKAAKTIVEAAKTKKVTPEYAAEVIGKATTAAAAFGPRYEGSVVLDMLAAIKGQDGFKKEALALAATAEKMIDPAAPATESLKLTQTLADVYDSLGVADKAKALRAEVAKLEAKDYAEYAAKNELLKSPAFAGRKAKSDRVVLVELFTGAECPPCIAVDMAFDGLEVAYKPSDAVFLQYHMHIPGPDPLTVPDGLARAEYYGEAIRGTPSIFFSGKPDGTGGGGPNAAKTKFDLFTKEIGDVLEKEPGAKVSATAVRKGEELAIDVKVSGVAKPGPKVTLRLALVEERVRYTGGNGLRYHTSVVRAMPGGVKGFAIEKAEFEKTLTVDVEELQKSIDKYLVDFAAKEDEFPNSGRAPAPTKLKLVAFVQDDATKEVLQATAVEVSEGK